jgi:hypothetical protein
MKMIGHHHADKRVSFSHASGAQSSATAADSGAAPSASPTAAGGNGIPDSLIAMLQRTKVICVILLIRCLLSHYFQPD